jgi:hypothetical protein
MTKNKYPLCETELTNKNFTKKDIKIFSYKVPFEIILFRIYLLTKFLGSLHKHEENVYLRATCLPLNVVENQTIGRPRTEGSRPVAEYMDP